MQKWLYRAVQLNSDISKMNQVLLDKHYLRKHSLIDKKLPESGVELGFEWALQHPQDYLDVLEHIPAVLRESGVHAIDVVGIGIDFTSCAMLPIGEKEQPLSFDPELKNTPHSWVKLWKHHAAQNEANKINEIVEQMDEKFLPRYGGKILSK